MRTYVDLKVEHGQSLYDNHLVAHFKSVAYKVGEIDREKYVGYLSDQVFRQGDFINDTKLSKLLINDV